MRRKPGDTEGLSKKNAHSSLENHIDEYFHRNQLTVEGKRIETKVESNSSSDSEEVHIKEEMLEEAPNQIWLKPVSGQSGPPLLAKRITPTPTNVEHVKPKAPTSTTSSKGSHTQYFRDFEPETSDNTIVVRKTSSGTYIQLQDSTLPGTSTEPALKKFKPSEEPNVQSDHTQDMHARKEELRFSEGAHEATKFDVMASSSGDERPKYTYKQLISLALKSKPEEGCTLAEIYAYIRETFPYYAKLEEECEKTQTKNFVNLKEWRKNSEDPNSPSHSKKWLKQWDKRGGGFQWENSIRHNLSLGKRDGLFVHEGNSRGGRGNKWKINPEADSQKLFKSQYTSNMAILNKNQPSGPSGGGLPIRTVILDNGTRLTIVQEKEKSEKSTKGRKQSMKEVQKTQTQEITKLIDLGDGQVITNVYLQGNDSQHETETSDPQIEENGSDKAGGQWETVYWDEGMQDEEEEQEEEEEENSTIADTVSDPNNFVIIQEDASASSDNYSGSNNFVIQEEVGTAILGKCSDPSNFVLVKEEIVDSANGPLVNAGEVSGQLHSELVIKEEDTSGKSVRKINGKPW